MNKVALKWENVQEKISEGGFTMVPHVAIDYAMGKCSPSEFKLLIYIIRQTIGFHRPSVVLSLKRIEGDTGMSKKTILKARRGLMRKGMIYVIGEMFRQAPKYQIGEYLFTQDVEKENILHLDRASGETPQDMCNSSTSSSGNSTPIRNIVINKDYKYNGDCEAIAGYSDLDSIEDRIQEELKRIEKKKIAEAILKSENPKRKINKEKLVEQKQYRERAIKVLEYLNKTAGKMYRPSKQNLRHIIARLKDGYTEMAMEAVIDAKVHDWIGKPELREYLRPETLFWPSKFESYLYSIAWTEEELKLIRREE